MIGETIALCGDFGELGHGIIGAVASRLMPLVASLFRLWDFTKAQN